jgi:hypothetical protein
MMRGGSLVGRVAGGLKAQYFVKRLRPEWAIACAVFCLFWGISRIYTGPTYLSDEVGYLGHAALLAGYSLDASTSWYAGYSLLLAPLFRIFSEPQQIWQAVIVLNAALWAASSLVLMRLVDRFFPNHAAGHRILAVGVAMLYPTWLAMSGYAFPTTAIVLVFLLSVLAALSINLRRGWSVIPYSLAVGFLYWVHPTGLAVVLAATLALAVFSFRKRQFVPLAVHLALGGGLLVAYAAGLHEWLRGVGTPNEFPSLEHYPSLIQLLPNPVRLEFWIKTAVVALGQVSYLVVSSLGLAVLGFVSFVQLARDHSMAGPPDNSQRGGAIGYASLFVVLSMSFILLGAASTSSGVGQMRIDQFIYGRYAEGVLMPFLAVGFLASCRRRWLPLLAGGLVACGALLNVIAHPTGFNNIINTNSFWPQYLIEAPNYLVWMALGAAGVVAFQVARQLRRAGKIVALVVLACVYAFSGVNAARFHQNTFASYSQPPMLVDVVRTDFEPDSCVGFNPEMPAHASLFQQERFKLYTFYLYDYDYGRISVSDWLASCDGPLFTYDIDQLQEVPGIVLLGRDMHSGLYLVAKSKDGPFVTRDMLRVSHFESWDMPSEVGELRDGSLVSTGQPGLLVYGPYVPMNAGNYTFVVTGAASSTRSAWVDVVSSVGSVHHASFPLRPTAEGETGVLASGRLSLDEDVVDLEVRIYVEADDEVRLDGYELVRVDVTRDMLLVSHFERWDMPSEVGALRDSSLVSTGQPGLLVYGPYVPMNAGNYTLVVTGAASSTGSAWVDVVSGVGSVHHASFPLRPTAEGETGVLASGRLSLDEDVIDLEVRVYVGADDEVRLDGYELVRVDVTRDMLLVSHFERWDMPSEVGELRDDSLVSTGQPGFLVYGPYVPMNAGNYTLVVTGVASSTGSAWVDVVSGLGSVQHAKFTLTPTAEGETGVLASGQVSLDEDVGDLEVRVYVGADDQVRLDGYEFVRVDVTPVTPVGN